MDQGIAIIIVSVISTVGAVLVAMLQSARRENRRDHATVAGALVRLHNAAQRTRLSVERVEMKVDRHLFDHEKETADGTARRDSQRRDSAQ